MEEEEWRILGIHEKRECNHTYVNTSNSPKSLFVIFCQDFSLHYLTYSWKTIQAMAWTMKHQFPNSPTKYHQFTIQWPDMDTRTPPKKRVKHGNTQTIVKPYILLQ